MRINRKKSAFSLIELSIVLIIIGLLIAGVTGGASLIKSSELRSVITEARGWAVAVNSFYNQFDAYPGDYTTAIANGSAGDGDGFIEALNGSSVSEAASAWLQMKGAGVLETGVIGGTTLGGATDEPVFTGTSNTAPPSKIKSSGWLFDEDGTYNYVVLSATPTAITLTASNTWIAGTLQSQPSLTPTDSLAIDSKYDDATATSGNIRSYGSSCQSSGTYTTATTTKVCVIAYRVDVNS